MKKVCICWLMVVVLSLFAAPSFADTVSVTFLGPATDANNGSYYISPYSLLVNGTVENGYCIDFNHEITTGQNWTAYVNSVSTSPITGTYQVANPNRSVYSEMAWLVSQYNTVNQVAIQQAIWDLSVGQKGILPYNDTGTGSTMDWYTQALNHSNYDGGGWVILTDTIGTPYAAAGGGPNPGSTLFGAQEFLVQGPVPTPEPGTMMLLGSGILGVYGFSRKKRTQLKT